MKTIRILFLLFLVASHTLGSPGPKYPVSEIPESLRIGMNAVVRENQMVFKILSRSKATAFVHKVITILNEKGADHATEEISYDKLIKIKSITATVYDAQGKVIRKLKNSEIIDQSSYDGFSLYNDDRIKHFDLTQTSYPYTVEIDYEAEYKFLFYIPTFYVLPGGKVSVQQSLFVLQYPGDMTTIAPRYVATNTDQKATFERTKDGFESISWKFENVKPIEAEPLGPTEQDLLPKVFAAPSAFEYDGYVGAMTSWNEYGQWIASLNNGRNVLPEETKVKIRKLTENLATVEEKTRAIYEYMQSKTRYVGIQLGIGGFQPFEASVVDQTGYGDCKALSNYMVSMLEVVGIPANYVLIRSGRNAPPLNVDFPSSQFNHAVVFVPIKSDTIWLECTSQTNPFGYMGTHTGDRKALAITKQGAEVVWTPRYSHQENIQAATGDVSIDMKGNGKAKIKTIYSGLQYENGGLEFILDNQYDEQRKWIQKNTDIPSFDIVSFSMANKKARIPSAIVNLDLALNRLATVSGKRLFLAPNLLNRSTFVPEKVEKRKSKVIRRMGYTDLDTIRYHLPEEIYPEFLPEPVVIKSRFGEYQATFQLDQGGVVYIRKMLVHKGEFPADSYNELIEFYKNVSKADNVKLVFLNKT